MKLSTRVRYAARALVELAAAYPGQTVSLANISAAQQISAKYLEQLLRGLRLAGLVRSVRGQQGGYSLARPPADITLQDVYMAVEKEEFLRVHCTDNPTECPMGDICSTRDTWVEVNDAIASILERTTIQNLFEKAEEKRAQHRAIYDI